MAQLESANGIRWMSSFTISWLIPQGPMHVQELAAEIEERRGYRPNPGTTYPALEDLALKGTFTRMPHQREAGSA